MQFRNPRRWRWRLKSAVAAAISQALEHGLAAHLARDVGRPLILGYHRVVDEFGATAQTEMPSMLISTRMFERHLDCVGRHFEFVALDEIGDHIRSGQPFDRPVAAVTFDDGYRDVYDHALPVLTRKGIPAAVFVVTDLVGKPFWQVHDKLYHLVTKAFAIWKEPQREFAALLGALGLRSEGLRRTRAGARNPFFMVSSLLPDLSLADVRRLMDGLEASVGNGFYRVPLTLDWPQLAAMQKAGFTIGSHTRNHVSLPRESAQELKEELEGSRTLLEERLGRPIDHFAYPGGQFTPAVVDAVARAGYRFAYTACPHGDARHPALTIERLLLWQGSSVDAEGRFSHAILTCQMQDLWPPSRRCGRIHVENHG